MAVKEEGLIKRVLLRIFFRSAFNAIEAIVLDYAIRNKPELHDELVALFDEIERTEL
jgi:hypothetical protein